jgi:hypothetical protein
MEFLHTDSDDPSSPVDSLRVNWYYRPRDVQRFNSDSRLVYATMHSDMCPLTSLRGLCIIKHRSEIDDLEAYRKERDTFYFVQVFDRFIRRWYECIPTSQIINVPEKVKKALDERWKFVAVETGRVKELTSAVKTCKRCTRYCASNESVDCAICKLSYHMNCVQPPLPKKPSRGFAWACAPCSRASERKLEAHLTPSASGEGTEAEVEEEETAAPPEEALPPVSNQTTRAPSPSDSDNMVIDDHPATQAEIALAQMWPMRYLGIHCRVEDALQYDDRAIYPRASSRLGPRHQANVNVWHGRPVELVKSAEIKKRYMKGGAKKEGKLSKETVAALEADRVEKAKRPKWVQDEPTGYVARGEDYPNNDPRCTAKMMFKMPAIDEKPKDDPSIAKSKSQEAERALDQYLGRAKQLAKKIGVPPFGTNFLDKAVELYCMNNYNTDVALQKLSKVNRVTHLHEPVLSKVDLAKFEEGVAKYGSEHRLVRLHMKTDLPNADIVRFYYLWKKTPRGREIWGNYPGRKGKKRPDNDTASRLHEEVAHDADDSAFDNDKASKRKRNFQCKFCETTHARQWRRAPGTAPGQTVMVEVKNGPKEKRERMLVALCFRCAGLWRKYAIQYEDVDEVAKKVTANAGRAWKRRVDEELLRELIAANEAVAHLPPLEPPAGDEPPKKKTKNEASSTPPVTEPARKKEKPPPPPKIPTPPPAPIIPTQPTWRALPCAVCHTGDNTISCNHCMLTVHQTCYGVNDRDTQIVKPNGEIYWVCQQCQNDRNPQVSTDYSCCLCLTEETVIDMIDLPKSTHKKKNDRDREKERMEKELADTMRADYTNNQLTLHRPILPREPLKPTTGNNWVHVYCAVFTPEIRFSDAKALQVAEGFQMIPSAKYEAVCKLCKNKDHQNKIRNDKGACVNCHHCNTSFHVSCAFEAGYQFGFDVTPVKGSRKDYQPVATLNGETGALTAAIWCKEHTVKSIIHPIQEVADESGRTALEVYAELYKQADLTLTGTVRKADQVQLTKSKAQHANTPAHAANRRESTATTAGARRGARNSTVAESRVEDADGATDASSLREGSVAPPDKRCAKCNIDVTPKWHLKPNDEPTSAESADKRMSMTLGEIADQHRDQPAGSGATAANGTDANHGSDPLRPQQSIRFMAPGASGRAWDGMPERNAPRTSEGASVDNAANGQQPSVPEQARTNGTNTANHSDKDKAQTEYLCHRCFVKRKMDPTPPPPSPPPRREPSPPKSYPLQLDWNGQAAPQRPPHPPSPWDDPSRQHPPPPHMSQGPPPPPQMAGMGPGPGFMHHQPPPPHPNHGFPPTYHHQPNGYPGPHIPPHASYGGYPPQPSPNGVFHPGHRPPPMNGFPPPGQPMPNGIGSPHGSQMQPPGFPGPHPRQQYGPRGRESPFPPHQAHLPPLGGPLYGSPNSHFPHPDAQQQVHQQPQPPSTSAPVQPSPQTAHARASSQSVQPATPHEGQSNGTTTTSGASASPSLHNLLS